jgi:hypothetical protein
LTYIFGDILELEVTGYRLIVAMLIGAFSQFHTLFKFEKSPKSPINGMLPGKGLNQYYKGCSKLGGMVEACVKQSETDFRAH